MNRISSPDTEPNDELLPEYDLDYSQAQPNRCESQVPPGSQLITLDPDVAQVFPTAESVNAVLRALITAIPQIAPR